MLTPVLRQFEIQLISSHNWGEGRDHAVASYVESRRGMEGAQASLSTAEKKTILFRFNVC